MCTIFLLLLFPIFLIMYMKSIQNCEVRWTWIHLSLQFNSEIIQPEHEGSVNLKCMGGVVRVPHTQGVWGTSFGILKVQVVILTYTSVLWLSLKPCYGIFMSWLVFLFPPWGCPDVYRSHSHPKKNTGHMITHSCQSRPQRDACQPVILHPGMTKQ